jgi:hypothetical protein
VVVLHVFLYSQCWATAFGKHVLEHDALSMSKKHPSKTLECSCTCKEELPRRASSSFFIKHHPSSCVEVVIRLLNILLSLLRAYANSNDVGPSCLRTHYHWVRQHHSHLSRELFRESPWPSLHRHEPSSSMCLARASTGGPL